MQLGTVTIDSGLTEATYSQLTRGYEYLFASGVGRGHWGEARSTALAGMALDILEPAESPWCKEVRRWLERTQLSEGAATGSWGEEIWDTAMCVLALKSFGCSSKAPAIQRALTWTVGMYSRNGRHNWHDEPWETSWALLALLTAGLHAGLQFGPAELERTIAWLVSFQDGTGRLIAPHYTAYVVLINEASKKVDLAPAAREMISTAAERASRYLLALLRDGDPAILWTGEAWCNGQILWALARSHTLPLDDGALLRKVVGWFEDRQAADGSWDDIEDTACAILGLATLAGLFVVEAPNPAYRADVRQELQRRCHTPPLRVRLYQRNAATGDIVINLSRSRLNVAALLFGVVTLGLAVVSDLFGVLNLFRGLF